MHLACAFTSSVEWSTSGSWNSQTGYGTIDFNMFCIFCSFLLLLLAFWLLVVLLSFQNTECELNDGLLMNEESDAKCDLKWCVLQWRKSFFEIHIPHPRTYWMHQLLATKQSIEVFVTSALHYSLRNTVCWRFIMMQNS